MPGAWPADFHPAKPRGPAGVTITTVDHLPAVGTVPVVPPAPEAFTPDPTALERTIAFELVFNVRDLGGLPAGSGSIRRGRLFRADGVHRLAGADLEKARGLGLRTVVDLRTSGEIERGRFPVDDHSVDWYHLPIMQRMWSEEELVATTGAVDFLRTRYLAMLDSGAASIARIIELTAQGTPLLFHCAAGKDRTGTVVGLALSVAGVSDDDVVADYVATGERIERVIARLLARPAYGEALRDQPVDHHRPQPQTMRRILEVLAERHGGAAGWLRAQGWSDEDVETLRASLR